MERKRGMLGNKEMKKTKDKYLLAFFLIYMVVLFRITVFRSTFSLYHVMENGTINLSLFQDYIPFIRQERWFLVLYLFVGNIIWFVPLGCVLLASGKVKVMFIPYYRNITVYIWDRRVRTG